MNCQPPSILRQIPSRYMPLPVTSQITNIVQQKREQEKVLQKKSKNCPWIRSHFVRCRSYNSIKKTELMFSFHEISTTVNVSHHNQSAVYPVHLCTDDISAEVWRSSQSPLLLINDDAPQHQLLLLILEGNPL